MQPALQAPIALAEMGRHADQRAGGFIPSVRDCLFAALTDVKAERRQLTLFRRGGRAQQPRAAESSRRGTVMTVFKVIGGRLLCHLHARAARQAEVPDTWFHAPSLQHEQFRRGAHGSELRRLLVLHAWW